MQRSVRIRVPIAAKAVLLIGALGVLSAAVYWFCLRSLRVIDRIGEMVTQRVEPVRLTLTETKIAVEAFGLATDKMAGTKDPDTMREAVGERAGQFAAAKTWLNGVVDYLPDHRDDVKGKLRRLDMVNGIADQVYAMIKAGDREKARWTPEFKFDPALVDGATSMNRLIDILGGQSRAAMGTAAADKAWTCQVLLAVLIGGTLVTLLLAMAPAHRAVARPLQRLAAVSRAITGSVRMQSDATHKIAESLEGAAARTHQLAATVAGVRAFASRTRQSAEQINQAVADLNRQAMALQKEAQHFVARVGAA